MKSVKFIDLFPTGELALIALDAIIKPLMEQLLPEISVTLYNFNTTDSIGDIRDLTTEERRKRIGSAKVIGYTVTASFRYKGKVHELHFHSDRPVHPLKTALSQMVTYFIKMEVNDFWDKASQATNKTSMDNLSSILMKTVNNENDVYK